MSASINIKNCKNEIDKQIIATDDTEIMKIFISNCAESRSSFKCDKLCGSNLADGNIPEAVQQVSDFRNYLWVPNTENVNYEVVSIRDHRTALLISDLFKMKDSNGNFDFRIGYHQVSKCNIMNYPSS